MYFSYKNNLNQMRKLLENKINDYLKKLDPVTVINKIKT